MNEFCLVAVFLNWIVVGVCCWLGWQLLRQNGRIPLCLDEVERRLDELEFAEAGDELRKSPARGDDGTRTSTTEAATLNPEPDNQSLVTSAVTNGEGRLGVLTIARRREQDQNAMASRRERRHRVFGCRA